MPSIQRTRLFVLSRGGETCELLAWKAGEKIRKISQWKHDIEPICDMLLVGAVLRCTQYEGFGHPSYSGLDDTCHGRRMSSATVPVGRRRSLQFGASRQNGAEISTWYCQGIWLDLPLFLLPCLAFAFCEMLCVTVVPTFYRRFHSTVTVSSLLAICLSTADTCFRVTLV